MNDIEKMTQSELEDLVCWHKFLYYHKAAPVISDREYDEIESALKKRFPESIVVTDARYNECPPRLWPAFEFDLKSGRTTW